MNVMIKSDLITMKNSAAQLAITPVVVAIFITAMTGSLIAGAAALTVMLPFLYIFSISAYDEMNGWERFRLTLPLTRHQVAYGRYASTLLVVAVCAVIALAFSAIAVPIMSAISPDGLWAGVFAETGAPDENVMVLLASAIGVVMALLLVVAALSYPLIMRFGMTKGTRLAPIALILILAFGFWLVGDSGLLDGLGGIWDGLAAPTALIGAAAVACALVLYVLSALLSARLYDKRQF